jgi:uncharacterized protein (DUF1697 family)
VSGYAAFLRGINLGPHRRIGSAELRSLFEGMGFGAVETFRSSGNVVFEADGEPTTTEIEEALAESLGYEVTIFLRTDGEIRAIAEHQPFEQRLVEGSKGKLQVALLAAKPGAKLRTEVLGLATDHDRLAFGERELYWLPSGFTRDSTLDMKAIHKAVGSTTMRTKGTIELLAAKYFSG